MYSVLDKIVLHPLLKQKTAEYHKVTVSSYAGVAEHSDTTYSSFKPTLESPDVLKFGCTSTLEAAVTNRKSEEKLLHANPIRVIFLLSTEYTYFGFVY